jgi:hypothetical protein
MTSAIGVVIVLVLAFLLAWLIQTLPLDRMIKRLLISLIGIIGLLWLAKIFIGFGRPFTWRP